MEMVWIGDFISRSATFSRYEKPWHSCKSTNTDKMIQFLKANWDSSRGFNYWRDWVCCYFIKCERDIFLIPYEIYFPEISRMRFLSFPPVMLRQREESEGGWRETSPLVPNIVKSKERDGMWICACKYVIAWLLKAEKRWHAPDLQSDIFISNFYILHNL